MNVPLNILPTLSFSYLDSFLLSLFPSLLPVHSSLSMGGQTSHTIYEHTKIMINMLTSSNTICTCLLLKISFCSFLLSSPELKVTYGINPSIQPWLQSYGSFLPIRVLISVFLFGSKILFQQNFDCHTRSVLSLSLMTQVSHSVLTQDILEMRLLLGRRTRESLFFLLTLSFNPHHTMSSRAMSRERSWSVLTGHILIITFM